MPTANDSTPDSDGRLWGWNNSTKMPCAYKDSENHVLFYVDYAPGVGDGRNNVCCLVACEACQAPAKSYQMTLVAPVWVAGSQISVLKRPYHELCPWPVLHLPAGSWLHTPACTSAPFPDDSVADSHFKVWGWDNGHLCAFKDDQQRPTPINKANNKLAWADAPACTQEPEPTPDNAVPDRLGCLWGWQLDRCSSVLSAASLNSARRTLPCCVDAPLHFCSAMQVLHA
jgi:hypothetical protein